MNRRGFMQLGAVSLCCPVVVSCEKEEQKSSGNREYRKFVLPEFSGERFHTLLDSLLAVYEAKGMKVSDTLSPPINEEELRARCSWFPGELPEEIVSLYAWRGGQDDEAWEVDPFWFRDNSFCSIERAKKEYQSMMEAYGVVPEDHELLKYSFPFATFNGGFYVLPTKTHAFNPSFKRPVISVLEGIGVYYYSIESMVSTCIDWVGHPDYDDSFSLPEDVELEIWRKHNPGIFEHET